MRVLMLTCLISSIVLASLEGRCEEKLAVGDKAPSLALKDQTGKLRTLDDLAVDGSVALVFHRSASW